MTRPNPCRSSACFTAGKRGVWSLTERGRNTSLTLEQSQEIFRRWVAVFQAQRRAKAAAEEPLAEQVAEEIGAPSNDYRVVVLEMLRSLSPAGFERLSHRILREAGFIHVQVTGQSNDGGIDGHGTLQINPLVSFKALFQCKRYTNSVTPSLVRDFRGAMAGRADKASLLRPARLLPKRAEKQIVMAYHRLNLNGPGGDRATNRKNALLSI